METSLENLYVNIGDERVNMKQLGVLLLPLNRMLEQQEHIIQIIIFLKYENNDQVHFLWQEVITKKVFFMQVWIHVPMRSPEDECEKHLFVDQVT